MGKNNKKKKKEDVKQLFKKKLEVKKKKPLKPSEQKKMIKEMAKLWAKHIIKTRDCMTRMEIKLRESMRNQTEAVKEPSTTSKIEDEDKESRDTEEQKQGEKKQEENDQEERIEEVEGKIRSYFKKIKLVQHVLTNGAIIYANQEKQKPLLFKITQEGIMVPTLYLIWEFEPYMLGMPITLYPEVTQYILGGADLMLPGLRYMIHRQEVMDERAPIITNGRMHVMNVVGNEAAIFAVGRAMISQREAIAAELKGKGIEIVHKVGDALFQYYEDWKTYELPQKMTFEKVEALPQQVIDEASIKNEEEEEEKEEDNRTQEEIEKEMDEKMHDVFYQALATLEESDIPCDVGVVYNRMRKIDPSIQMKKSSYRKLQQFMHYQSASQQAIKTKSEKSGQMSIIAIYGENTAYREARKQYLNKIETEEHNRFEQQKREKKKAMIQINRYYQLPSQLKFMISNYDKHTYYDQSETNQIFSSFVKEHVKKGKLMGPPQLIEHLKRTAKASIKQYLKAERIKKHHGVIENPLDKKTINTISKLSSMDDDQMDAYFSSLPISAAKVLFQASLKPFHQITHEDLPSFQQQIQKGNVKRINLIVNKQLNRLVTSVYHLHLYPIPFDTSSFRQHLSSSLGVASKIYPSSIESGSTEPNLTLQGDQATSFVNYLSSSFGIPSNLVSIHKPYKSKRR